MLANEGQTTNLQNGVGHPSLIDAQGHSIWSEPTEGFYMPKVTQLFAGLERFSAHVRVPLGVLQHPWCVGVYG